MRSSRKIMLLAEARSVIVTSFLLLLVCLFLGCASPPKEQAAPPPSNILTVLSSVECGAGDFRGQSVEASEPEALAAARSVIAQQIQSSVKVQQTHIQSQTLANGNENLNSGYVAKTVIEAALSNAHDARVMRIERGVGQVGAVLCMSRPDAAKGFVERARPVAATLEFAANSVIKEKLPRSKSDAWQKTRQIWNEFIGLHSIIAGLDQEKAAIFEPVVSLYAKSRDDYLSYCETAKQLYWNPEQSDPYSEIAFSKLSDPELELQKADCKGNGISLIYKNTGYECKHAGMYRCSHKPILLIASCGNAGGYRTLETTSVETYQNVEDVALRKLREKLEYETFWSDWKKEIKKGRPICE